MAKIIALTTPSVDPLDQYPVDPISPADSECHSPPELDRNQHSRHVSNLAALKNEQNGVTMVSSDSTNDIEPTKEERVAIDNTEDAQDDAEILLSHEHVHTQSEITMSSAEHSHLQSYYQPSPPTMFVHSLSIDRSSPSSLLLHQCWIISPIHPLFCSISPLPLC